MTDREFLELAAKAVGCSGLGMWDEKLGYLWDGEGWSFDPINDDGDALRLAVKLNLIIGPFVTYVSVAETYDKPKLETEGKEFVCWHHETKGDKQAATRLAIVRAAAEIGKATT